MSVYGMLSKRDREALDCLASDLPYIKIASKLGLTINGFRDRVRRIYRRLGVHSREEAIGVVFGSRRVPECDGKVIDKDLWCGCFERTRA